MQSISPFLGAENEKMRNAKLGAVFTIFVLIVVVAVIESNGLFGEGSTTQKTGADRVEVSNSNTLTVLEDPEQEGSPFVSWFNASLIDQYSNVYYLDPVLMAVNKGNDNGIWTAYYYGLIRTWGPGNGDYGDVVAYLELWDARNLTEWQCVQYEFSRSGWGAFDLRIDGVLVWHLNSLFPTYKPPAPGMVEGLLFANGTHVP